MTTSAMAQTFPTSATLKDIIINAYSHHPQLKSIRSELYGTRETVIQARATYLPQIALTGGISASDRKALLQSGDRFDQNTEPKEIALRLNQTLYTGGRRGLAQRGAAISVEASEARYESASTGIAAGIIQDYLSLISAQKELDILDKTVLALTELETSVIARKAAGDSTRTEIAQASSRLASAKARRASAKANLRLARDRLLSKTGFLVNTPTLPAEAISPIGLTKEDIKYMARQISPDIRASRLSERAAKLTVASEKRKYLPTVTLSAAARSVRDSSPTINSDDDLSIGVNFTLPLYSGGSGTSQTRQALANFNAARYSTQNIVRENDLRINQLWAQLQSGKTVLEAQKINVAANKEALEGITRGEAVGLSNTQDILEARQNLLNAELSYAQALYQQYTARLLLKLYIGEFDVYDFE